MQQFASTKARLLPHSAMRSVRKKMVCRVLGSRMGIIKVLCSSKNMQMAMHNVHADRRWGNY